MAASHAAHTMVMYGTSSMELQQLRSKALLGGGQWEMCYQGHERTQMLACPATQIETGVWDIVEESIYMCHVLTWKEC